ncbi:MAG: signal recognition particle receptor subunit beta [Myxococcota bacterium]|jgi:signal recognition particle receptor subunit beta
MATINFATREIIAKVVYFGASRAGTTTAVRHLHQSLPSTPSRLHTFGPSASEQILYFEYMPGELPRFGGFDVRVQVYALPGGVRRRIHREEVLGGTDAVVFVADARRSRTQANVDALVQLEDLLDALGVQLQRIPAVLVVNRVDHEDARSEVEVGLDLNTYNFPVLSTVAKDGRGVIDAQTAVMDRVSLQLRANLAGEASGVQLQAVHDADAERDDDVVQRHIAAIAQKSSEFEPVRPSFDDLPSGRIVTVPFRVAEIEGLRPIHLVDHRFEGEHLVLDLVFETSTGTTSRAEVVLDQRQRNRPEALTTSVGHYLPDRNTAVDERDLPGWAYGAIGILGGAIIGLLLGYVTGLIN